MTSSTSNSEQRINQTPPDDSRRYHARRVVALKTIFWGGGAMLIAMFLVNGLVSYVRGLVPSPFSVQRIQTSAAALPAALGLPESDARSVVYVFGSSLIEFGFSPDIFDQQLTQQGVETVSYNFGFGNSDPSIQKRFSHRFSEIFFDSSDVIDLVVFEFSPFQSTERRAQQSSQLLHAANAAIGDWRDFLVLAKEDYEEAVALFNTRYIRNGVPAEAITSLLAMPIQSAGKIPIKIDEPGQPAFGALQQKFYVQLFQEWFQGRPPGAWDAEQRGGLPPDASESTMTMAAEVMQRKQHPERMRATLQKRIECCDMLDLVMDEQMLSNFIDAIVQAQKVSRRVDVLLMPRNSDVVQLSAQGQRNLQVALDRIRFETDANVVDFSSDPTYGVEWFIDADHLTPFAGRTRFSRQLADYYVQQGVLGSPDKAL